MYVLHSCVCSAFYYQNAYTLSFHSEQNAVAPDFSPHLEAIFNVTWGSFEQVRADPVHTVCMHEAKPISPTYKA